jgi:hypothetical protein
MSGIGDSLAMINRECAIKSIVLFISYLTL